MGVLAGLEGLGVIVAEELIKEVRVLLGDVAKGATVFVLKGREVGWDSSRHGVEREAPD